MRTNGGNPPVRADFRHSLTILPGRGSTTHLPRVRGTCEYYHLIALT